MFQRIIPLDHQGRISIHTQGRTPTPDRQMLDNGIFRLQIDLFRPRDQAMAQAPLGPIAAVFDQRLLRWQRRQYHTTVFDLFAQDGLD